MEILLIAFKQITYTGEYSVNRIPQPVKIFSVLSALEIIPLSVTGQIANSIP